ncbi:hypothetical protein Bca52824_026888 [Brassica carinata]|uniref:Mitochondrial import inner membrane translocase subunit TIM50 n=1 Tax=Brassica carinata TaxID=52824 RepID=A0A8X7V8C6_BRACI|nr:hypothetical protein Bca52824_026888 [Brassica carinata]
MEALQQVELRFLKHIEDLKAELAKTLMDDENNGPDSNKGKGEVYHLDSSQDNTDGENADLRDGPNAMEIDTQKVIPSTSEIANETMDISTSDAEQSFVCRTSQNKLRSFLRRKERPRRLTCLKQADMDKCTKTEASCLDNKNKKVVFKDLSVIWKKGDYCKSNTVLLDDSPYKALLNPPHTAIFPYTYNHGNENDTSLGDDGDLRLYLKKLVEAENVQEFIQKNPFGQEAIKEGNKDWQFNKEIEINIGNNNDGVKDNNLNRALDDLEGRTASLL